MEKHILSKSTFIKGHQCLKALYLHKKRPFLRDKLSAEQLAKFKRGHKVGKLAQQLFPGGVDVSPKSPSQYQKSVLQTQELIAAGETIIYEAAFQFNKVLVMLDILVKTKQGWEAYEVKSSLGLSDTYYTDAALQYYVITQSGLDLVTFSLVHVDENYVLKQEEKIDVQAYFIKQEVSTEIKELQIQIAEEIERELQILTEAHSPNINVGAHCFSPYPCDFQGFCWKTKEWANSLIEKQLESLSTKQPFVSEELKNLLSAFPKNTMYLGFVARQTAVPPCVGLKPYQNQMFAYACISEDKIERNLFPGKCSDYQCFIELLIKCLLTAPKIIVYDKEYLELVLEQTADIFPSLSIQAKKIIQNTLGIKQWINDGHFYYPELKHNLLFKDVVRQVLNTHAFSKQPIYADVLAVNMFEQLVEKTTLLDETNTTAQSILDYTENLAKYTLKIVAAIEL